MQWITVTTPPFGWIEQFDTVRAQLGEIPAGLQARYLGTADGKLRIVTLWESKEHADRYFAERLGPTLARALGPEFIEIDVARSYVREPVAARGRETGRRRIEANLAHQGRARGRRMSPHARTSSEGERHGSG